MANPDDSGSIPGSVFAPIFILLGISSLGVTLGIYLYRQRRPTFGNATPPRTSLPFMREKKRQIKTYPTNVLTPEALSELKFSIPRNVPTSPKRFHLRRKTEATGVPRIINVTLSDSNEHKLSGTSRPGSRDGASTRPVTPSSVFSEAFLRPVAFMSGLTRSTASIWQRQLTDPELGQLAYEGTDKHPQDPSWSAPTNWDIAEDEDSATFMPSMPMPAFLHPNRAAVDPRTIDPSSFPMPRAQSRHGHWISEGPGSDSGTTTRRSSMQGGRSSIGGDSIFCTCDLLDDINEGRETPSRLSIDSIYISRRECRACARRPQSRSGATSRTVSLHVKKMRRPRRLRENKSQNTVVAGRLYEG